MGRWHLHAGPLSGASNITIGLDPNAADSSAVFRFALLGDSKVPVTVNSIQLRYPDPPIAGQAAHYKLNVLARDGTPLATDLYMPFDQHAPLLPRPPFPMLLIRTPYEKQYIGEEYISWATKFNVVVALQYFRGRPGSSGKWPDSGGQPSLFRDHAGPDHFDAVDTVRWLKQRNFSSGKLLLVGGSAMGLWMYQAAPALGGDITAMYSIAAAGDVVRWATIENGCYKRSNVEGWLHDFGFPPELLERARVEMLDPANHTELDFDARAADVDCPGWHETGWWDVDVEATIASWRALSTQGGRRAKGQQWLLIGPWTHEGIRGGNAGELSFPYSSLDQNPTLLPLGWEGGLWSAWQLDLNPFYSPPEERVRAYFVGEQGNISAPNNTWYSLPTWPPAYQPRSYYLGADGALNSAPSTGGQLQFDCDPADPVQTLGGSNLPLGGVKIGPYDQRPVESHPGVLVFRSAMLAQRITIAGPVEARLYVSSDAKDSDVMVKLIDEYPDGRRILIADAPIRLSWNAWQEKLGAFQPGRAYKLDFTVGQRAYVFEQGHRIGIDVQASNYPRFDVNPGTGAQLYEGRGVVQHNTLYLGAGQPSQIVLPVYEP